MWLTKFYRKTKELRNVLRNSCFHLYQFFVEKPLWRHFHKVVRFSRVTFGQSFILRQHLSLLPNFSDEGQRKQFIGALLVGCSKTVAKFTEKTVPESLFSKVANLHPPAFSIKYSSTGIFLCILRNSLEELFCRTPQSDCFRKREIEHFSQRP